MEPLVRFAAALFNSLAEAAPYLVIGYLIVALVREFVPGATLTRYLGGRGPWPVVNALGIGALLPICSCGSIPIGVGLARSGAAVGTVLALMTSAPAISPVVVVLGYTLLGPRLLLAFVGAVLAGSFLLGFIGNHVLRGGPATTSDAGPAAAACGDSCDSAGGGGLGARFRRAFRWAYWDLGADVSLDLLIGLAVAAAIIAFVPREWVTAALGQGSFWAMLCVILLSIPMYTCSVPALLVVHGLLLGGASPGSAVAFLVAGPASNLGEINAIRGAMGRRVAIYYCLGLVLIALAGGLVADQIVFRDRPYTAQALGTEATTLPQSAVSLYDVAEQVPAWHFPFVVLLTGVMILGIARRFRRSTDA